jgi:hypothetical protein
MTRSRYHRAVSTAKAALKSGHYRDFLQAAEEAQRHGHNRKLALASAVIGGVVRLGDGLAGLNPARVLAKLSSAMPQPRLAAIGLTSALALGSCGYEVTQGTAPTPVAMSAGHIIR